MASPSLNIMMFDTIVVLMAVAYCASTMDFDPLQEFCITNNSGKIFINGVPCLDPNQAKAQYFKTSLLTAIENTNNKLGSNVIAITTQYLPGVNTQGLILAHTDFATGGVIPPHNHPRAFELVFVLYGTIVVGFMDTNNTLFSQMLYPGDVFVFPKGLVHFLQNVGNMLASVLSGLNNQNPGVSLLPNVLFASNPPIPNMVLEKAFQIDQNLVGEIRKNLGA